MNPNIKKPLSPSRQWKKNRRRRPTYPVLKPGEEKDVERIECGRNVAIHTAASRKSGFRRVTNHSFIFAREIHMASRSKYPKAK